MTTARLGAFVSLTKMLRLKVEMGDPLLFLYLLAFVRQYFWVIDNNFLAWALSITLAAVCWYFYVSSREEKEPIGYEGKAGASLPFWLIAVMPLAFVYLMRVVFPDGSFDVLNYRIFNAERAMRGLLYLPDDFFPTPGSFNPSADIVTGIFRHVLGYRVGTIVNLLAMIWVAHVVDKLLRPLLRNPWLRASGVLLVVFAEHLLFEINSYLVDLLALPLLLEATYLAISRAAPALGAPTRQPNWGDGSLERRDLLRIALLLGMSVAFKLTNASAALPIVLLCVYYAAVRPLKGGKRVGRHVKQLALTTLLCAAAFLGPLVPFSFYLYRETGNPVFPVLNGIFKSVYWPAHSILDPRWGPVHWWENLVWPILISVNPERLSELAVYSGKISIGFVVAIIGFVLLRRDRRLRDLALLLVGASLMWSASTGYIRYGLYVEVMATIVVLGLAAQLVVQTSMRPVGLAVASLLVAGMVFQTCLAAYYVSRQEWSHRPTIFTAPGAYRSEARHLFRDHSLRSFLDTETLKRVDNVEVWIGSSIKTSAITVMLRPDAPTIGVNHGEFFVTPESREKFRQALARADGKRVFSFAFNETFEEAKALLRRRGFEVKEVVALDIPYYSQSDRFRISLIEATRAEADTAGDAQGSLPDSAYRAQISSNDQSGVMKAGTKESLRVTVKNIGTGVWPSRAPPGSIGLVRVANRWLAGDGTRVVNELDSRAMLPRDLGPGDEAEFTLNITVPEAPGDYVLEVDMVHEGVTWFHQIGSPTLRWNVRVEK